MNILEAKLTAIFSLGIGSLLMGLAPLWIVGRGRQQSPLFLSSLLCFGGGVLLATSLVHILPEFRESIPELKRYAEIIFIGGFFLLYIIDEMVHYYYEGSEHQEHHIIRREETASSYGATERDPIMTAKPPPYNPSFDAQHNHDTHAFPCITEEQPPSQLCHVGHEEPCVVGPAVTIGLLIALSVHSLLEGLVVGLQDVATQVLLLLGAVASHKFVVAFCLGMELASNPKNAKFKTFIGILIFTLGSVGGIIVGMYVSDHVDGIVIPVLQGLAGGTLLYVTVSEVIPRERARWHQEHRHRFAGVIQFLSVGVGFTLMTALTLYLDMD